MIENNITSDRANSNRWKQDEELKDLNVDHTKIIKYNKNNKIDKIRNLSLC